MHSPMVPIRPLGAHHRERIHTHLLSLSGRDRYLRFGYPATDEQVQRYVAQLDFERDEVFGIFDHHLELVALSHVAFSDDSSTASCAEFGVSVADSARGRGYGARLFERAVLLARNREVRMMFIHALSENTAMLKIARNAGASIHMDGPESEAYLELPPAGPDSRWSEIVVEQYGELDYQFKKQAQLFWQLLGGRQQQRQQTPPTRV